MVDISNPLSPRLIGSYDTPGYAYGVAISGSYVYVTDGESGLQIIEQLRPLEDISFIDSGTILHGATNLHFIFPRRDAEIAKNTKTLRPLRLCERFKKTQFMPSLSILWLQSPLVIGQALFTRKLIQ